MIQMIHKLKNSDQTVAQTEGKQAQTEEPKTVAQMKLEFLQQMKDKIDEIEFESEEKRMEFEKKIEQKIRSGAKLSAREMNYLRKYNPYLYQQMLRVQAKREMVKEELKHCKTKQEAQAVISRELASIDDKDPAREAMIAAVVNVSEQFLSSDAYQKLPDTEEDLKREKETKKSTENPFKEDEESESEEEIEYSINLGGYQEATVATFTGNTVFAAKA